MKNSSLDDYLNSKLRNLAHADVGPSLAVEVQARLPTPLPEFHVERSPQWIVIVAIVLGAIAGLSALLELLPVVPESMINPNLVLSDVPVGWWAESIGDWGLSWLQPVFSSLMEVPATIQWAPIVAAISATLAQPAYLAGLILALIMGPLVLAD